VTKITPFNWNWFVISVVIGFVLITGCTDTGSELQPSSTDTPSQSETAQIPGSTASTNDTPMLPTATPTPEIKLELSCNDDGTATYSLPIGYTISPVQRLELTKTPLIEPDQNITSECFDTLVLVDLTDKSKDVMLSKIPCCTLKV
jgi:hypothetical protein